MALINASLLSGLNKQVRPKFDFLVSKISQMGYDITFVSVYRSFAKQKQLRNEMGVKAALPGYSSHNYGIGIDINLTNSSTGKKYIKSTQKKEWEATGIPALIRNEGFRWGGDFSVTGTGGYDPIHIDLVNKFPIPSLLALAKKTYGNDITKIQANNLDLSNISPSYIDEIVDLTNVSMLGSEVNVLPVLISGFLLVIGGIVVFAKA